MLAVKARHAVLQNNYSGLVSFVVSRQRDVQTRPLFNSGTSMEVERKPIRGFEGYFVSSDGRIWKLLNGVFVEKKTHEKSKKKPYLKVALRGHTLSVHRVVMETFVGPRPSGMETRHLDGNVKNNALSNLKYGTPEENRADQVKHGTYSKLNPVLVSEIRSLYESGRYTYKTLSKIYGVCVWTIMAAVKKQTWRAV